MGAVMGRLLVVVVVTGLAVGCEPVPRSEKAEGGGEKSVWERQLDEHQARIRQTQTQLDQTDEQIKRRAASLSKMEEQDQRMDRLLDKWEEQARRVDLLIDRAEKASVPAASN